MPQAKRSSKSEPPKSPDKPTKHISQRGKRPCDDSHDATDAIQPFKRQRTPPRDIVPVAPSAQQYAKQTRLARIQKLFTRFQTLVLPQGSPDSVLEYTVAREYINTLPLTVKKQVKTVFNAEMERIHSIHRDRALRHAYQADAIPPANANVNVSRCTMCHARFTARKSFKEEGAAWEIDFDQTDLMDCLVFKQEQDEPLHPPPDQAPSVSTPPTFRSSSNTSTLASPSTSAIHSFTGRAAVPAELYGEPDGKDDGDVGLPNGDPPPFRPRKSPARKAITELQPDDSDDPITIVTNPQDEDNPPASPVLASSPQRAPGRKAKVVANSLLVATKKTTGRAEKPGSPPRSASPDASLPNSPMSPKATPKRSSPGRPSHKDPPQVLVLSSKISSKSIPSPIEDSSDSQPSDAYSDEEGSDAHESDESPEPDETEEGGQDKAVPEVKGESSRKSQEGRKRGPHKKGRVALEVYLSGHQRFLCPACNKSFTRKSNMFRHLSSPACQALRLRNQATLSASQPQAVREAVSKEPTASAAVQLPKAAPDEALQRALSEYEPSAFPPDSEAAALAARLLQEQAVTLHKLDSPACNSDIWRAVMQSVLRAWEVNPGCLGKMDVLFLERFGPARHPEWT